MSSMPWDLRPVHAFINVFQRVCHINTNEKSVCCRVEVITCCFHFNGGEKLLADKFIHFIHAYSFDATALMRVHRSDAECGRT